MLAKYRVLMSLLVSLSVPWTVEAADSPTAPAHLGATQIIEKHEAARGGLQAWHAIQTMSWSGTMQGGYADSASRSAMWVQNQWAQKNKSHGKGLGANAAPPGPAGVSSD